MSINQNLNDLILRTLDTDEGRIYEIYKVSSLKEEDRYLVFVPENEPIARVNQLDIKNLKELRKKTNIVESLSDIEYACRAGAIKFKFGSLEKFAEEYNKEPDKVKLVVHKFTSQKRLNDCIETNEPGNYFIISRDENGAPQIRSTINYEAMQKKYLITEIASQSIWKEQKIPAKNYFDYPLIGVTFLASAAITGFFWSIFATAIDEVGFGQSLSPISILAPYLAYQLGKKIENKFQKGVLYGTAVGAALSTAYVLIIQS